MRLPRIRGRAKSSFPDRIVSGNEEYTAVRSTLTVLLQCYGTKMRRSTDASTEDFGIDDFVGVNFVAICTSFHTRINKNKVKQLSFESQQLCVFMHVGMVMLVNGIRC